ncbi:MAG: hypothetical protein HUJ25_07570 [Crocinitomicaceae bacterium]|nr:hypothetical protein [Crocinitomicaceae bacterium]
MEKEEKKEIRLKGGIYITPKDIQVLSNCTIQQARLEHQTIRDILEVERTKLTVKAYCEYFKLDYDLVVSYLNPYR